MALNVLSEKLSLTKILVGLLLLALLSLLLALGVRAMPVEDGDAVARVNVSEVSEVFPVTNVAAVAQDVVAGEVVSEIDVAAVTQDVVAGEVVSEIGVAPVVQDVGVEGFVRAA